MGSLTRPIFLLFPEKEGKALFRFAERHQLTYFLEALRGRLFFPEKMQCPLREKAKVDS
jgi:hypothetical protein